MHTDQSPLDRTLGPITRLAVAAEALAAVAVHLGTDDADAIDPSLATHLARVHDLVVGNVGELSSAEREVARGTAAALFRLAADLLDDPTRPPGWTVQDPAVLRAIGQASAAAPALIERSAEHLPGLAQALARPGARFLDIGCGVAALTIAACRRWPEVCAVGIDPWAPALAEARANVAAAALGHRIDLRETTAQEFTDGDAFDLVWLPAPFLPPSIAAEAARAAVRATRAGGWVVLATFATLDEPLADAVQDLRIVRAGGAPLDAAASTALLTTAGCTEVVDVPRTWASPMRFVAGRAA